MAEPTPPPIIYNAETVDSPRDPTPDARHLRDRGIFGWSPWQVAVVVLLIVIASPILVVGALIALVPLRVAWEEDPTGMSTMGVIYVVLILMAIVWGWWLKARG